MSTHARVETQRAVKPDVPDRSFEGTRRHRENEQALNAETLNAEILDVDVQAKGYEGRSVGPFTIRNHRSANACQSRRS